MSGGGATLSTAPRRASLPCRCPPVQAAGLALPPGGGSPEQQVAAAQQFLQQRGVGTVVVSRGSKGCIATSGGE